MKNLKNNNIFYVAIVISGGETPSGIKIETDTSMTSKYSTCCLFLSRKFGFLCVFPEAETKQVEQRRTNRSTPNGGSGNTDGQRSQQNLGPHPFQNQLIKFIICSLRT